MSYLGEVPALRAEGVTVEIGDKPCNDLLPPEMDAEFIGSQLLPQDFFGRRQLAATLPIFAL